MDSPDSNDPCAEKAAYATAALARAAAQIVRETATISLSVYYCLRCDAWHLTSRQSDD